MPTVWATTRGGETRQIDARSGVSLKDNLKRGGMDEVLGICGGCASCGTCHVYVADDWVDRLPPIQDDEETHRLLRLARAEQSPVLPGQSHRRDGRIMRDRRED